VKVGYDIGFDDSLLVESGDGFSRVSVGLHRFVVPGRRHCFKSNAECELELHRAFGLVGVSLERMWCVRFRVSWVMQYSTGRRVTLCGREYELGVVFQNGYDGSLRRGFGLSLSSDGYTIFPSFLWWGFNELVGNELSKVNGVEPYMARMMAREMTLGILGDIGRLAGVRERVIGLEVSRCTGARYIYDSVVSMLQCIGVDTYGGVLLCRRLWRAAEDVVS